MRLLSERLRGGAFHREQLHSSGYSDRDLRALVRAGELEVCRRSWFVTRDADDEIRAAARLGGRLTCTTLARRRGWWMPDGVGEELHLHYPPGSSGPRGGGGGLDGAKPAVAHWTRPIVPVGRALIAGVEDALAHIAHCHPPETALVIWESACSVEKIAPEAVRRVQWSSTGAFALAHEVNGLADSGLEVLVCAPLRRLGVQVRQQVVLAGKPVDALVGRRLVLQIDGWAHHSSSTQRSKDIAHDAELRLRGYTVLRFSYAQVVHDRAAVERLIRRALAAGLHTNSAG
ncbi:MAG: DUF559 domain-containing protein [Microbacterium sp.]|uniref:endonuclease domain-containing protein n=1 Tax=Microbacterium sp. TaxID=51671 RepID=UPI001AD37F43|nr:DUF559 domain-containing protein [Microbacterium sp.]MBN9178560.1 DUF559 domain-containing protein [Microbacterium sp.]